MRTIIDIHEARRILNACKKEARREVKEYGLKKPCGVKSFEVEFDEKDNEIVWIKS